MRKWGLFFGVTIMIDQVNNFPSSSGIYKITSPTGKIYIGEAKNLKLRCKYYLTPSRIKKQTAIYNSLMKYGTATHSIEVLEICSEENLLDAERHWQEKYDSVNNGLNCYFTPTDSKKKLWSEETKQKMSASASGKNNGFYGKTHTEATLKKISESSTGKNNPNFGGKLHTEEYIQKQIISNSKCPLEVIDDLTKIKYIFKNSKEVAVFCNTSSRRVRYYKNKNWRLGRRYFIKDLII
jgi:group I intron endonuclease